MGFKGNSRKGREEDLKAEIWMEEIKSEGTKLQRITKAIVDGRVTKKIGFKIIPSGSDTIIIHILGQAFERKGTITKVEF